MTLHTRALPALTMAALLVLAACGPGTSPGTGSAPAARPTTVAAKPGDVPAAGPAAAAPAVPIAGPFEGEAKSLTGAGSTFAAPLYQKWFDRYNKLTGVQINYQPIGSGGGIQGLQNQTLDFGATDAPMTDEQLAAAKGGPILHVPTALGGVVLTYNIPNYDGTMKLTGDTIAGIFLGDISKWNDPKLVADNPELANVDQDIVTVHRSDGSGTTFAFTDYLSKASPAWKSQVGNGTSVNWPGGLGGSGNPGVAGEVKQNPYSIGYVELIYAAQNNLPYGSVKNQAGAFVQPSLDSVTAALSNSVANIPPDLRFSIANAPGADSYPISTATWILAYQNMADRAKGLALTRVLWWGIHEGQQDNVALQYATVPPEITAQSEAFIKTISVNGTPVFPGT
jgi:phosphate transport system substrate-binding protein